MENIQKRALCFSTDDKLSNYTELLQNTKIPSLTLLRLKYIAVEIFKCLNNLYPSFMSKMFNVKENKYDMSYLFLKLSLMVKGLFHTMVVICGISYPMKSKI